VAIGNVSTMPRVADIQMLSKREQRWVFSERNPKYLALCGLIHVKHLAIAFAVIEGMIVTVAVVKELIYIQKSIWTFGEQFQNLLSLIKT
jgi:hypothetical protein